MESIDDEEILPGSAHPSLIELHERWCDASGRGTLPSLGAMLADDDVATHPGLLVVDVERESQGRLRFTYARSGPALSAAFERLFVGLSLDDVVAPQRLPIYRRVYGGIVEERRGHYWLRTHTTPTGEVRTFERLLLPLAEDGRTVDRLLGLFVWLDGEADHAP